MAKVTYSIPQSVTDILNETRSEYQTIELVRKGITFSDFNKISDYISVSFFEWHSILQLSERTLQRYKEEKKRFDTIHSERIIQVLLLYKSGINVFGNKDKFKVWLESENFVLGKIKPRDLLDNSFSISLLNDELMRIQHGVLS
jgi:putative toxin-antitoxin system antitoxin component (TIGR02293 family)